MIEVCQGLEYLHGHNIVHGDLKGVRIRLFYIPQVRLNRTYMTAKHSHSKGRTCRHHRFRICQAVDRRDVRLVYWKEDNHGPGYSTIYGSRDARSPVFRYFVYQGNRYVGFSVCDFGELVWYFPTLSAGLLILALHMID